jgi:hypothetical protein
MVHLAWRRAQRNLSLYIAKFELFTPTVREQIIKLLLDVKAHPEQLDGSTGAFHKPHDD